jgi:hypothetical protein
LKDPHINGNYYSNVTYVDTTEAVLSITTALAVLHELILPLKLYVHTSLTF